MPVAFNKGKGQGTGGVYYEKKCYDLKRVEGMSLLDGMVYKKQQSKEV
jgi:hypothetical protein